MLLRYEYCKHNQSSILILCKWIKSGNSQIIIITMVNGGGCSFSYKYWLVGRNIPHIDLLNIKLK